MRKKELASAEFVALTKEFLSPDDSARLLEGGCGNGGVVLALSKAGYNVTGVDFAPDTIEKIKSENASLHVEQADVRFLPFEDACFDGYWSLGVIEHFWEGYDPILSEMHRVLKSGGYAFITFPWLSPIRRIKVMLGLIKKEQYGAEPDTFYQFSLTGKQVADDLRSKGFEIVRMRPRSALAGVKAEFPMLDYFLHDPSLLCKIVRACLRPFSFVYGHSILIVARKCT